MSTSTRDRVISEARSARSARGVTSRSMLFLRGLPGPRHFSRFRNRLRECFTLRRAGSAELRRDFYDTFDWRLFRKGFVLEHDAVARPVARCRGLGADVPFTEQEVASMPRFCRDLDPGLLRGSISGPAGTRALLYLGGVYLKVTTWDISDDEGKIIAHVEREHLLGNGPGGRPLESFVRVRTLRGYEEQGRRIAAELDLCTGDPGVGADPFHHCMRLLGKNPGGYAARLRVPLDPNTGAGRGLARLLHFLSGVMEANRSGIIEDIDIEFLHDFRIAARRSRTLVTQVRGVLPDPELAEFRDYFAWLSRITCAQRDLDVFLENLPEYENMVPPGQRAALAPFRAVLEAERDDAHARLVETLESRRFRERADHWHAYLRQLADPGTTGEPVQAAADRAIRRMCRKFIRQGRHAHSGAYSESLHELRKTGKKLRYLLEAFYSLYPRDDIEDVVSRLRRLQTTMGDIVDCHVQRQLVLDWRARLDRHAEIPPETFPAMDSMAAAWNRLEQQARPRFRKRFRRFSKTVSRRRTRELFG